MVSRRRAVADGTKRTSRDLGGRHLTKNRPGLPQKSSETPSTALLVKRSGGFKDPAAHKRRRPKDPAAQTLNRVVAPFQAPTKLLRSCRTHNFYLLQQVATQATLWDRLIVMPLGLPCSQKERLVYQPITQQHELVEVTSPVLF